MPKSSDPIVKENGLQSAGGCIQIGSAGWLEWLAGSKKFQYCDGNGHFMAQCETRRGKPFWYAYRRQHGRLSKVYLGKSEELSQARLTEACLTLAGAPADIPATLPVPSVFPGAVNRIDTGIFSITKVNGPMPPAYLVPRPRLTRQINTPVTLVYAPSGFGKSTLLNEWKQCFAFPVAWLSLDEQDNQPVRFWNSVILSLQTIDPGFGSKTLPFLSGASASDHISVAVTLLLNELAQMTASMPGLGLIIDDVHHIHHPAILDTLQACIDHLPPKIHLIFAGRTKLPLAFGHLRSHGLITELEAHDLRFTQDEAAQYIRQYTKDAPLAAEDIARLTRHTEGWAAGLTLTALALSKPGDRRQFIDTFSGAHIYMREYFMETVLQNTSPEQQMFLLKTAILKQMTGSLCNAVTGQTGGAEMLNRLWSENLFVERLEQQGWYRYHDLFAEMLTSLLQMRYPESVPQLHQRAAQWYREQFVPADAIYHLLSIEAWEDAATLIEEMTMRELETYGEDSRLLRWLQALPKNVVQRHKTLLFVYLRLANGAFPQTTVNTFIDHIEENLLKKSALELTADEQDVLSEITHIRQILAQGNTYTPPQRVGNEYDAKWELLNGLHLVRIAYNADPESLEKHIVNLLRDAEKQRNLFLILMAGGVLAGRSMVDGQFRRSEKYAHRVLDDAMTLAGKLPEPASIALAALTHIHLGRNELDQAQKRLAQVMEVDPNPTSTNMIVQVAIIRAKIQSALGQFEDARSTLREIRDLHKRHPSGQWSEQDLTAYEAIFCLRAGDLYAANQLIVETEEYSDHPLSRLVQAEIMLNQNEFDAAEKQLFDLVLNYPRGIQYEGTLYARILLAIAYFKNYKISQACQTISEAIRLAAPEKNIRHFLNYANALETLLSLALKTENLSVESRAFIKEILRLTTHHGEVSPLTTAEMDALSTSASISTREKEVLKLMSAGNTNREIAQKLSISESTIKTHLANIFMKLNVNSRVQALARAQALKLV